jgi:hypothetical protein
LPVLPFLRGSICNIRLKKQRFLRLAPQIGFGGFRSFAPFSAETFFSMWLTTNECFMAAVPDLCYNLSMSQTHRVTVTEVRWNEAVASYELGYQSGAQIARELDVSPATVCREFKRRGARKGCRVGEVVAELVANLDAEAKEKARLREAEAVARAAVMDALVGELMDALTAADQAGDLTMANPKIARIDKALQLVMR